MYDYDYYERINRFEEASKIERRLTEDFLISTGVDKRNIWFTDPKSYAAYDGKFKIDNVTVMFEVKVRSVYSDRYKATVIELNKYKYLMTCYQNSGVLPYIMIFFTDGKVLVQNLLECDVKLSEKYAPRTTAVYSGKKVKQFVEIEVTEDNLKEYTDYRNDRYDDDSGWY